MIKTTIWGNLAADPELREVEVKVGGRKEET